MYLFTSAAAVELECHLSILHMKGRKDLSSVNSVGNGVGGRLIALCSSGGDTKAEEQI